ncbi:MAG: EAL domain-containing protein [Lachnospiraceae bacterium]|nr:EAL domain-containing protein [Lachnospiraceae bacterium]
MKRRMVKLEEKFILLIIAVGFICFGFLGYLSYSQISKIIIAQNTQDAMGVAQTAACEIDGDMFEQISAEGDEFYQQVYNILSNHRSNELIQYIYTMKRVDDEVVFVVDTDVNDPAGFLEKYPYLDPNLPVFNGEICCDLAKTSDQWGEYFSAYAPIINSKGEVVGLVGCDIAVANINRILSRLRNLILILISVFAVVAILASVLVSRILISKDPLTELNNYEKMIKDGKRFARKNILSDYSAIMYEIKDQKYINQKLGADKVEALMLEYAQGQRKRMKSGDYLYSIGNGRFFALIKKEREQLFLDAIRKVAASVKGRDGVMFLELDFVCGVFRIREQDKIQDVHNFCALALDAAKEQGDVQVQWFEESMIEQMISEREVINSFRNGLLHHEFVVYYQPKVNLDNNMMCGAEALVRWIRGGKIVPPDSFIPFLEKNHMITELDFYVFEQVCKDLKDWKDEGYEIVKISSNFSKLHLKNPCFAEDIMDIVKKYQIDTKYIEVELTESSGYFDLKALENFVEKMNAVNISTSIDDFGTGYSSLSLLKDLDFNVVKMDKSFFRDLESGDKVNEKMVENVIRMVRDLDRDIISEGIETEKQALFLKKLQAPVVQGFLYDRPLPHSEFEKRLKNPRYEKKFYE